MANLKNRFVDQALRLIRRHLRFEICAVDDVQWHKEPNDDNFNTVTVIIRDRRQKTSEGREYYRERLPCLQSFIGHHLGMNWNPRVGDLVRVWFYQERKGIVLGTTWSWAQKPICRASPYDWVVQGGQWIRPYQDPATGDFIKQPYPEKKKPYCFKWFHGTGPDGKPAGEIGPGRDWLWLFDFCHEGDACPDCRNCRKIDNISRANNHGFKFYSEQTESRKAYPYRGIYFVPSGSYWMFESSDQPSGEYLSEIYTEGKGYWRIQGAVDEDRPKGHLQHSPNGTMQMHSATNDPSDNLGARCKVYSPEDTAADQHGLIAADLQHLETGALVRIYKDGSVRVTSLVDPSGQAGRSEIFLKPDGNCWLWDLVDDTYIEMHPGGEVEIRGQPITLNGNVHVTGNMTIDGLCSHGACSCLGAQDFTSYSKADPNERLTVAATQASCIDLTCNESAYICKDFGQDYFVNIRIIFNINVSACNGGGCGCCGLSNADAADVLSASGYKLVCEAIDDDGLKLKLLLLSGQSAVVSDAAPISTGMQYYCALKKAQGENTASLDVYTDQNMTQKLATLSISDDDIPASCRYLYSLSSLNSGEAGKTISCGVGNMNVSSH